MSILTRLFNRGDRNVQIVLEQSVLPSAAGLSARQLYRTQANLHAVVSFLADNIAQLPLRVYTRNGENDRTRDRDSVAAKLLYRPNRDQTAYEFMNAMMLEYYLFGRAIVWVLPDADSDSGFQLRIIPDEWVIKEMGETKFAADTIRIRAGNTGIAADIDRDEFVVFRMYDPGNPAGHQSPILSLRQTLSEQISADKFRKQIWDKSGRFNSYITRPATVQPWDETTRARFVEALAAWSAGGSNAGKMPVLEDGMDFHTYKFDAAEAQWSEAKQLSREDVAAAYHVNPSLIWHTSTQTYASAKDNARALYADCLGPNVQMIQQRFNSFLLPKIGADPNTYVEFNLDEKLKGSFEERAAIIQSSVGAPWITRNEARAEANLPPVEGGDELVTPLNVLIGGQASPTDADSTKAAPAAVSKCSCGCHSHSHTETKSDATHILIKTAPTKEEQEALSEVLAKFFRRQARSVLPKIGANDLDWWDAKRWNKELADDLEPALREIAKAHGTSTAELLDSEYVEALTTNYIRATAEARARMTNDKTRDNLEAAINDTTEDADTPADVMEKRETVESSMLARSAATAIAAWAVIEACEQAVDQPAYQRAHPNSEIYKTWRTGPNPRDDHAAMNGETVPYKQHFSNGASWPGDDVLGPDGTCGCNCTVDVDIIIP